MLVIIRIAAFVMYFSILTGIIGLNIYSDYRDQLLLQLVIFLLAYCTERWLIKQRDERYRNDEIIISSIMFVAMMFWGLIIAFVLDNLNWSKAIVESIINYEIINKQALNLTSGVLVAILGYQFAKYLEIAEGKDI